MGRCWRNNYSHWKITCEEIHIWIFNSNISEFELLILCSFQFQYFWIGIWTFNPNISEFDQSSSVLYIVLSHIKVDQTSIHQPSKVDQTSIYQPSSFWPTFQRVVYCNLPYQSWSNQHLSTFQRVSVFLHQCVSTNVFQPMCFNQCVSTPIYMSRCQHQYVPLITCICSAGASIQTTFNASVPRKHSNHIQCQCNPM